MSNGSGLFLEIPKTGEAALRKNLQTIQLGLNMINQSKAEIVRVSEIISGDGGLETLVKTLTSQVAALNKSISTLSGRLTSIEERLSTLEAAAGGTESTGPAPGIDILSLSNYIETSLESDFLTDIVQDKTPQLGGDLDTNGNDIIVKDGDKILIGTGNDGQIYSDTDILRIKNVTQDKDIRFSVNDGGVDSEVMTIQGTTQYVGIGTNNPQRIIHFYANPANARWENSSTGNIMTLTSGSSFNFIGSQTDNELRLLVNDLPAIRIRTSANTYNVAIGNIDALAKLDVRGDARIGNSASNYAAFTSNGIISFVGLSRIGWSKKTASAITLSAGTSASALSDLQSFDTNTYAIQEAAATPGIDLIVDFTSVTAFNWVKVTANYDGSDTHSVSIQLYNWSLSAWETFDSMDGLEPTMTDHSFFVPSDTSYIGTGGSSGQVRVRFVHTMAGNASHNTYINVVALYQ